MNTRALTVSTIVGTILQVAMVVLGHSDKAIMNFFAIGGMGFSLVAGVMYARLAAEPAGRRATGGAIAGGVCAIVGIFVSYMLGDVPASLLALGTASSVVTGAIGGLVGRWSSRAAATA